LASEDNKTTNRIEKYLIPIILGLMPLVNFNQGVDYIDSMYSPGNFVFFKQMKGTWVVATFLANAIGHLFTLLPGGGTYIGIRIYTSLVISAIALISYFTLRKRMPWYIVAVGETIAICLCWCPSTILYNYLTYLFMTVGLVFLYKGLTEEKPLFLVLAGLSLGINLFVRFPNVVETGFILAVWVYGFLKKKKFTKVLLDTLWCLLGYVIGAGLIMGIIVMLYGFDAYVNMITSLFGMTGDNTSYKPIQMVMAVLRELRLGLKWPLIMTAPVVILTVAMRISKGKAVDILRGVSFIAMPATILLCMKLGMFNRDYNSYQSIMGPAVTFVILAIAISVLKIFSRKNDVDTKLVYGLILLCIAITPLGSNNALFPVYNNLFLIAPIILMAIWKEIVKYRESDIVFPATVMVSGLVMVLFIQSVCFDSTFVFRGSKYGEERDGAFYFGSEILRDCTTNEDRRGAIAELIGYWEDNKTNKVLLLGNIPGVSYFLNVPTAIPTSWPDLGSYSYETYKKDMKELEFRVEEKGEELPTIILSFGANSVITDDKEAQEWFNENKEDGEGYLDVMLSDPKYSDMRDFIKKYGYEMQLRNEKFVVYTASDNK
jgi:low affinity Fe/Cu permease